MGLATAFQILLIANLFANPEECPVPNSLQEIAEKAKKSVQHKLHREAFLAQFDSVDDFKIYNTERKSGTSENAPATPSYIFDRLETKANAGGTIDDLASLFANEIILYEKAQFEIFTASRKFYEENGWDFDLKLNQLQAKLNESPSDDLKQEYEKLKEKIMAVRRSVFDKFKAAGVPLLELPRLWNEGQNSVIQKALLETQPKFFEWLDKNPKAGWKEIERSGFLSPIVTEEVVRAWLRAYFLQGKNNEPGPVARITRKTFSMGEHLYLDTEQVGDGADEDLKKWIHSEQVAQYKAWNDEVEKELAELRKVNERFGEILNEQALRERLDLQLVQARARVLLQGRYSVRGRTLYKGDGVSIDWDFVEELGLTEVLSKEEVEETLIEKKLEYARESLLSYAEQLGQQLGKARDAGNQTEIRRLESSLKSDVNILNRWKEVDRVLSAHPEKLSRADIETQLKLRFERAAGMSEIFQLVERTRSQATSAWIESELKRRKLDQFMPIEKVLELAAQVELQSLVKQAFSEKPSQDFLARLQTSEAKPTIGFLQKQRREQARVEFEALQRRFPNILKPEEFEELYNKEEALHAGLSFLRIQTERDIEHFDPRWINLEKEKIEPQFGLGTNEPMKWSQLRNVLERQGVFNVIPESEIQARIVTARLVRLLPAYRQALREVQWAQGEDASSAMKTLKVLKRAIESIAEEFPAQFDRPAFEALRSGWAKDAKAEYDQEVAETNARNLKKEEDRWFITKLWGVGMKTAETLWVLGTVPAAEVAGFVASPFVNGSENWGRDLFQFWHKKGQAQVSGSAFGTDAEFARSSLGSLALKAVPIVQAGGAFEVALSQVGSYYDSYVKYVYDIETNEELEDLKRADGWVRGGYLAFATAEGAGSAAVILASGGTTAMGSRGAQYFAKKGIQVAANSRRAVVAGQAITVGQVAAVQTGMAFGGAISLELYHYGEDALSGKLGWDNKPRQFEWDQVLFNTYIGANQSMLFSGGMSIASKLRSAQHVSKQVALGIKPNAAVWDAANRKAAHQLSFLDLIEGSSSLPDSVDMAVAAHTTGDWRMLVGAYGATGVNLYDMKDVKDSLKGIRWQP